MNRISAVACPGCEFSAPVDSLSKTFSYCPKCKKVDKGETETCDGCKQIKKVYRVDESFDPCPFCEEPMERTYTESKEGQPAKFLHPLLAITGETPSSPHERNDWTIFLVNPHPMRFYDLFLSWGKGNVVTQSKDCHPDATKADLLLPIIYPHCSVSYMDMDAGMFDLSLEFHMRFSIPCCSPMFCYSAYRVQYDVAFPVDLKTPIPFTPYKGAFFQMATLDVLDKTGGSHHQRRQEQKEEN